MSENTYRSPFLIMAGALLMLFSLLSQGWFSGGQTYQTFQYGLLSMRSAHQVGDQPVSSTSHPFDEDHLGALRLPGRLTFGMGLLAVAYLMTLAASRVSRSYRESDLQSVLADVGAVSLLFTVLLALAFVTAPPRELQLAYGGRLAHAFPVFLAGGATALFGLFLPQPRRSGD